MINKDQVLTIVGTESIAIEQISKQLVENYNINIISTKQLSNNAYDVVIPTIEQDKIKEMRKYTHEILLIYDDEDKRFVSKDEMSTLYTLDNGVITNISYVTKADLDKVFN